MQALRRISRAIELHSHSLASRYGLTVPQLAVLKALAGRDGLAIGEVTRAVHLSQATVTGILDRLARRGLVERRRGQADKRKVHVYLTAEGERVLAQAPPLLHESFLAAFDRLHEWEQTQILSSLQRIVALMEAERIDAAPMLASGPMGQTPEQARSFFGQEEGGERGGPDGSPQTASTS
jgi:DNA-binding MarR family transcriptional regulator